MPSTLSNRLFGFLCISLAIGIFIYWLTILISISNRAGVNTFSISIVSTIIGISVSALVTIGMLSITKGFEHLTARKIIIKRTESGFTIYESLSTPQPFQKQIIHPSIKAYRSKSSMLKIIEATLVVVILLEAYLITALYCGVATPFIVISTSSMVPILNPGDLGVLVSAQSINVNDIIAFNVPEEYSRFVPSPIVHKVSAIVQDSNMLEQTKIYYKTARENPPGEDPWLVPHENVIGKLALRIPYLGIPILILKSPQGILSLTLIAIAYVIYHLYVRKGLHGRE